MRWDPVSYLEFAAERGRPFEDLLGRLPAEDPQGSSTSAAARAA